MPRINKVTAPSNRTTTNEKGTKAKPPPRVLPREWIGGIVGQNLHHVSTKCNKKVDTYKRIEKVKVDIKNCPSCKNARGTIVSY